jgi:hypothetical protein
VTGPIFWGKTVTDAILFFLMEIAIKLACFPAIAKLEKYVAAKCKPLALHNNTSVSSGVVDDFLSL